MFKKIMWSTVLLLGSVVAAEADGVSLKNLKNGWILSVSKDGTFLSAQATLDDKGVYNCGLFVTNPAQQIETIDQVTGGSCSNYQVLLNYDGTLDKNGNVNYFKEESRTDDETTSTLRYYYKPSGKKAVEIFQISHEHSNGSLLTSYGWKVGNSNSGFHFLMLPTPEFQDQYRILGFFEETLLYDVVIDSGTIGITGEDRYLEVNAAAMLKNGTLVANFEWENEKHLGRKTILMMPSGDVAVPPADKRLDNMESANDRSGFLYVSEDGTMYFNYKGQLHRTDLAHPAQLVDPYKVVAMFDVDTYVKTDGNGSYYLVGKKSRELKFNSCNVTARELYSEGSLYYDPRSRLSLDQPEIFRSDGKFSLIDREKIVTIPNTKLDNYCTKISIIADKECRQYFKATSNGSLSIQREFSTDTVCGFTGKLKGFNGKALGSKRVKIIEDVPGYGVSTDYRQKSFKTRRDGTFSFRLKFGPSSFGYDVIGPLVGRVYREATSKIGVD